MNKRGKYETPNHGENGKSTCRIKIQKKRTNSNKRNKLTADDGTVLALLKASKPALRNQVLPRRPMNPFQTIRCCLYRIQTQPIGSQEDCNTHGLGKGKIWY